MNNSSFFSISQSCMERIKTEGVSFEIISEFNCKTVEQQMVWTQKFAETLSAMNANAIDINDMIENIDGYSEGYVLYLYDLDSLISDFVYHSSRYMVYICNIEDVFQVDPVSSSGGFVQGDAIFENSLFDRICGCENFGQDRKTIFNYLVSIHRISKQINWNFLEIVNTYNCKALCNTVEIFYSIRLLSLKLHMAYLTFRCGIK